MNKRIITLVVLILLTIISAVVSSVAEVYLVISVLLFAVLKFIGVSFYFMEMKHAHVFWKGSIVVFLALFSATILIII